MKEGSRSKETEQDDSNDYTRIKGLGLSMLLGYEIYCNDEENTP